MGKKKSHIGNRAMAKEQAEWAVTKMREGYKTDWIADALYVNKWVLKRNIAYWLGFENFSAVLEYYDKIPLVYGGER